MNLKFGTVIPAGIAMSVTTWENDCDDYKTQTMYNMTREEVEYWVHLLEWFTVNEDLGNEYYNHLAFTERLFFEQEQLDPALTKKFFDIIVPSLEDEDNDEVMCRYSEECDEKENDIRDALQEVLGNPVQYDYDFCRVVESVEIFDIKEAIVIPDAPKPIATIEGKYRKPWAKEVKW